MENNNKTVTDFLRISEEQETPSYIVRRLKSWKGFRKICTKIWNSRAEFPSNGPAEKTRPKSGRVGETQAPAALRLAMVFW
ncbi:hypothetical protein AALC17_00140 [Oscillospiraceae bacterium 38-13]